MKAGLSLLKESSLVKVMPLKTGPTVISFHGSFVDVMTDVTLFQLKVQGKGKLH